MPNPLTLATQLIGTLAAGAAVVSTAKNAIGDFAGKPRSDAILAPKLPNIGASGPEATRGQSTTPAGKLQFPADLPEKHIITFEIVESTRTGFQDTLGLRIKNTITLPMPAGLVEKFGMSYQSTNLDPLVGIVAGSDKFKEFANEAFTNPDLETFRTGFNDYKSELKRILASAPDAAALIGARALPMFGDSVSAVLERSMDMTLNPYTALQFQSTNLRSHSFNFRMSPNSKKEMDIVKEIVRTFKIAMHPLNSGPILKYPFRFNIYFGARDQSKLYTIYESFLTDMSVNYAPQGNPAFFNSTNSELNPVEVSIELTFTEIKPLSRDLF